MGYFNHQTDPPKFGKTALELLSEKTFDPPSLASAYGFQVACGSVGAFAQVAKNWMYKRPMISGNLLNTCILLSLY